MKTIVKGILILATFFSGKEIIIAQDIHTRNNGASQNAVVIIRSDNNTGDQTENQTSDIDFQIWDSNTRLNIPQGRIGIVGEGITSQAKEASGRMAFYTTNEAYPSPELIERMRIDQMGNIGIGTTNPNSPLTIGYNNGSNQIAFKRADGLESFYSYLNPTGQIIFENISGGGDYDFRSNIGGRAIASTLFIEGTNGNIGIGTTTPDMKLTVKGDIHAEEMKIDLSVPAPDYVFRDEYNLRSLKDVENFIKENSHLPEIPSAKEFEQNGVMQAEMDMNLLKKIEELTLYTIAQEKKIKSQNSMIEKQNEQLNSMNILFLELQSRLEKLESEK